MLEDEIKSFFREIEITEKSYLETMMRTFTYYESHPQTISDYQLKKLFERKETFEEYQKKGIKIKYYYDKKTRTITIRVIH